MQCTVTITCKDFSESRLVEKRTKKEAVIEAMRSIGREYGFDAKRLSGSFWQYDGRLVELPRKPYDEEATLILEHAFIVQLYDFRTKEDTYYIMNDTGIKLTDLLHWR